MDVVEIEAHNQVQALHLGVNPGDEGEVKGGGIVVAGNMGHLMTFIGMTWETTGSVFSIKSMGKNYSLG